VKRGTPKGGGGGGKGRATRRVAEGEGGKKRGGERTRGARGGWKSGRGEAEGVKWGRGVVLWKVFGCGRRGGRGGGVRHPGQDPPGKQTLGTLLGSELDKRKAGKTTTKGSHARDDRQRAGGFGIPTKSA